MSRSVLVTGATDGLGRALAARAHREGWDVLAHGRSEERLAALASELEGVRTFRADLASLAEVAALADAVGERGRPARRARQQRGHRLHGPRGGGGWRARDGHELRFAVNYLAGYALTRRLLALLRALGAGARSSMSPRPARRRSTSPT